MIWNGKHWPDLHFHPRTLKLDRNCYISGSRVIPVSLVDKLKNTTVNLWNWNDKSRKYHLHVAKNNNGMRNNKYGTNMQACPQQKLCLDHLTRSLRHPAKVDEDVCSSLHKENINMCFTSKKRRTSGMWGHLFGPHNNLHTHRFGFMLKVPLGNQARPITTTLVPQWLNL